MVISRPFWAASTSKFDAFFFIFLQSFIKAFENFLHNPMHGWTDGQRQKITSFAEVTIRPQMSLATAHLKHDATKHENDNIDGKSK